MKLAGRVAVVTGAASGIGRAVTELFLAEGAHVAAVDVDRDGLRALDAAVGRRGVVRGFPGDVSDEASVAETAAAVVREWSGIDVLVTCAAVSVGEPVRATTTEAWDRVFAVNVRGTFLWIRAVLPSMLARHRGAIVTVASQLALAGGQGNASYIASKGAVIALTRSVAVEHAADGIRANVLIPGAIETPLLARAFARAADPVAAREDRRVRHPMGRFGRPEEVARAALFLASDDASFTTGGLLPVDGGWLAG